MCDLFSRAHHGCSLNAQKVLRIGMAACSVDCYYICWATASRPQLTILKNLPKKLSRISKKFTYYALYASHCTCIMLQYEQH